AHPNAGAQELLRIDGVAADARLVVDVRTGRAAGGAEPADDLSDPDVLSNGDVDFRQMSVAGRQPVAMIDLDQLAIAAVPARDGDDARGGGADRIADVAAEIDPRVHRRSADEGIDTHAEPGGGVDFSHHRLADRYADHGSRELIHLGAGDIDAVELAVERIGGGSELERHERPAGGRLGRIAAEVEAKIGEYAAHALDLGVVALLDRIERRGLPGIDPIERILQAGDRAFDAAAERMGGVTVRRRGWHPRFEPRLAVGRGGEQHLVADRRRLERGRRRFAEAHAARR